MFEEFKLSRSHYLILIRTEKFNARLEDVSNNLNIKELKRQVNSALYERLLLRKNKKKIIELSQKGNVILLR